MSEKIELDVPDEIVDMFESSRAYADCRDSAIKNLFGWKRAAYFSKRKGQEDDKAWAAVRKIYPEHEPGAMLYKYETKKVEVGGKVDKGEII
jgi:hypothetical protein